MTRSWAIARLTFFEGIRMRIVLVLLLVLFIIMLRLPFALKGDETLAGRLQTFLAYSLAALSLFMSLATAFFACATLTREIRDKTIQLVASKPVRRFELLAGKWLGVNLLNLLMVALAGLLIYGFAYYIKTRPEQFQRDRIKLNDAVWTARVARQPTLPDFRAIAERRFAQLKEEGRVSGGEDDAVKAQTIAELMKEAREAWVRVPPTDPRVYEFTELPPPENPDQALQVRFKARGIPLSLDEMVGIEWAVLDPDTGIPFDTRFTRERGSLRHEFLVRATVVRDGRMWLGVNSPLDPERPRPITIYFEGESPLQVLYKVGGFELNYVKALALIWFKLAFISAVGLFFGTFVSFPVACFSVLSMILFCIGVPWWMDSIGANLQPGLTSVDPYGVWGPAVRSLLVPALRLLLPDFTHYDGVDALIDGLFIETELLVRSATHTLVYGLALLALPGWLIFRGRELALPTS